MSVLAIPSDTPKTTGSPKRCRERHHTGFSCTLLAGHTPGTHAAYGERGSLPFVVWDGDEDRYPRTEATR